MNKFQEADILSRITGWRVCCAYERENKEIVKFLKAKGYPQYRVHKTKEGYLIKTLEGDMLAGKNDYIIKGINGEVYPCKPDIFHKTYDEVI